MTPAASRVDPVVPALVGAACISSSAVVVRLAHTAAGTTAFYRCVLALPVLVLLAVLEQRRAGPRAVGDRVRAVAAGALLGLDLVLWTHAIYDVGAGIATVLGNLQVLFVAAIAWVVFRERPGARFLVTLPVVMVGVVLVAGLVSHSGSGYHPVAGILYGLGTSVSYAGFILVLRRSASDATHVAAPLAEATFGAAAASLLLGLAVGEMPFGLSLGSFGWLLCLALVSQTVGWLFITWSLARLPAAVASLLLLFQPAAALVLAAAVLSQRPSLLQIVGALLVCGGVLYAVRGERETSAAATSAEPTPG